MKNNKNDEDKLKVVLGYIAVCIIGLMAYVYVLLENI